MTIPVVLPPIEPIADANSLVDAMQYVLDVVVARYEQFGIDLPERRYWTLATPAADAEQLVVSFGLLYTGPPGDQATEPVVCNSPRSAQMSVQILRCIPTTAGPRGGSPTAVAIQSASTPMAVDAWMLLDTACLCSPWEGAGVIATVTADEAQGGFQGVTMTLTVQVP